jgi:hypothetical protein
MWHKPKIPTHPYSESTFAGWASEKQVGIIPKVLKLINMYNWYKTPGQHSSFKFLTSTFCLPRQQTRNGSRKVRSQCAAEQSLHAKLYQVGPALRG